MFTNVIIATNANGKDGLCLVHGLRGEKALPDLLFAICEPLWQLSFIQYGDDFLSAAMQ